jgi:hypothetical protein
MDFAFRGRFSIEFNAATGYGNFGPFGKFAFSFKVHSDQGTRCAADFNVNASFEDIRVQDPDIILKFGLKQWF